MEIRFKRRLTNVLLTTFLPSFLLVGICYATTRFKRFYFEAAVTVNLTVMLVTTTLFVRSDNVIFDIIPNGDGGLVTVLWRSCPPPPTSGWSTSG